MTVLVLGGQGFVGRAAGRALKTVGLEAVSASRRAVAPDLYVDHVVVNRQDESKLSRVIRDVDPMVILDLACYQPFEIESVVRRFRGRRYVFASTFVYPRLGRPVVEKDFVPCEGEEAPPRIENPFVDVEKYFAGKRWCETLLGKSEIPWVSLRLPMVIGARPGNRITAYLHRLDDRGPILIPAETIDLLLIVGWVEDVGRACANACQLERAVDRRAYNIAYGDVSGRQLIETLARLMGRDDLELVPVSRAEIPPEAAILGPLPESPGYITKQAAVDLDFCPAALEVGLGSCVEWFRAEKPAPAFYNSRPQELEIAFALKGSP